MGSCVGDVCWVWLAVIVLTRKTCWVAVLMFVFGWLASFYGLNLGVLYFI